MSMAENRLSRELETREKTTRKRAWNRPELLPNPTPEPGYTYHWVRVSTRGVSDPTNVSSKLREGWEPVRADAHPELKLLASDDARHKDNVVVGGLMLCKAPIELANTFFAAAQSTSTGSTRTGNSTSALDATVVTTTAAFRIVAFVSPISDSYPDVLVKINPGWHSMSLDKGL
jgi:hypothetical protein